MGLCGLLLGLLLSFLRLLSELSSFGDNAGLVGVLGPEQRQVRSLYPGGNGRPCADPQAGMNHYKGSPTRSAFLSLGLCGLLLGLLLSFLRLLSELSSFGDNAGLEIVSAYNSQQWPKNKRPQLSTPRLRRMFRMSSPVWGSVDFSSDFSSAFSDFSPSLAASATMRASSAPQLSTPRLRRMFRMSSPS
jgi:hypothetical protein